MKRCKRCTLCGISYPFWTHNDKCDVCEGKLDVIVDDHDKDWKEKVEMAKNGLADSGPEMPGYSDPVTDWRLKNLLDAGYDTTAAAAIAVKREIDLHQAVTLVQQGCAPSVAAAILL